LFAYISDDESERVDTIKVRHRNSLYGSQTIRRNPITYSQPQSSNNIRNRKLIRIQKKRPKYEPISDKKDEENKEDEESEGLINTQKGRKVVRYNYNHLNNSRSR